MTTLEYIANKNLNRYNVLLKLLNKLLVNMKKPTITDPVEFVNIRRDELLIDENDNVFEEMKDDILEHFGKYKCSLKGNYKEMIKNFILSLIRSMCDLLWLKFNSKMVKRRTGKNTFENITLYSIVIPS